MRKHKRFSIFAMFGCLMCAFSVSSFAQNNGSQQSGTPNNGQRQQGGRQGQQQQGIGGSQSAQPARPGQQSGSQTSNQTDVTPTTQTRPAQVPQASPPPSVPQRGTGTIGEPAGTTTPRAPIGRGGLPLPNIQVPTMGAAHTLAQTPATLSLADAVGIAIDNNLSTLLAESRVEEAQSLSRQQRAALLPNLYGTSFQQNRTLNLRAQGIAAGGSQMSNNMTGGAAGPMIPAFVGPFNTFDARIYAAQSIFDLAVIL